MGSSKPYLDLFVIMFINDILVYSRSKEEYKIHLRIVLGLLKRIFSRSSPKVSFGGKIRPSWGMWL